VIDENYKTKVADILKNKSPDVLKYYLFIKTYLGTLLPYPSDGIIKEGDLDKEKFNEMYKHMDYSKLE